MQTERNAKGKAERLSLSLPRCRLSYVKIVQGESNEKEKTLFLFIAEPPPVLCKDSARREQ